MELICTSDGDVPLWMRIGDGNESDSKRFAQSMKEFKNQFNIDSLIVADSYLIVLVMVAFFNCQIFGDT